MKKKKTAPKKTRGRPPVDVKKTPFQVMLDPRYVEHFRKTAKSKKISPQDLARMALCAFVPDPFNPFIGNIEFTQSLLKKAKG